MRGAVGSARGGGSVTNKYGDTVYGSGTVEGPSGGAPGKIGEALWLHLADGRRVRIRVTDEAGGVDVISLVSEVIH